MAVALLTCLSTVDVLFVEITESVSTYREKHILNFTRLQFLYNDTNSLETRIHFTPYSRRVLGGVICKDPKVLN
jgi:hypothetical protein